MVGTGHFSSESGGMTFGFLTPKSGVLQIFFRARCIFFPNNHIHHHKRVSTMASRTASRLAPLARNIRCSIPTSSTLQARLLQPSGRAVFTPLQRLPHMRLAHSIPRPTPKPANYTPSEDPETESSRPAARGPAYYQLSFTCVPCGHRSHHNISKQGYHTGSTLITCPSCRNRHIISDHLKIFGDKKQTIEDIMKEKGQLVKRGSLGEDGDIEFWPEDQDEAKGSS